MLYFIILCFVQAITEFLPVSSSTHLSLINYFFNIENLNPSYNAALHLGTLIATCVYFFNFLKNETVNFFTTPAKSKLWTIGIASLPAVIVGFIFKKFFNFYESKTIIILGILIGSFLLCASDFCTEKKEIISLKDAFIIGLFQCFAFFPGMSRLGMCLVGARFLGISRSQSLQFSILLSIPAVLGAILLTISNIHFSPIQFFLIISLELIFGLITLSFFIRFYNRFFIGCITIYRIFLAVIYGLL